MNINVVDGLPLVNVTIIYRGNELNLQKFCWTPVLQARFLTRTRLARSGLCRRKMMLWTPFGV